MALAAHGFPWQLPVVDQTPTDDQHESEENGKTKAKNVAIVPLQQTTNKVKQEKRRIIGFSSHTKLSASVTTKARTKPLVHVQLEAEVGCLGSAMGLLLVRSLSSVRNLCAITLATIFLLYLQVFCSLHVAQNQEHFIEPWLKGKTKNRRTSMGLFVFINDVIIFGRYSRFSLQATRVLIVYNVLSIYMSGLK